MRIDLRNVLSTQGSTQSEKSEVRVPHVYYIVDNFAGKNLNKPPQIVQPTRSIFSEQNTGLWSINVSVAE